MCAPTLCFALANFLPVCMPRPYSFSAYLLPVCVRLYPNPVASPWLTSFLCVCPDFASPWLTFLPGLLPVYVCMCVCVCVPIPVHIGRLSSCGLRDPIVSLFADFPLALPPRPCSFSLTGFRVCRRPDPVVSSWYTSFLSVLPRPCCWPWLIYIQCVWVCFSWACYYSLAALHVCVSFPRLCRLSTCPFLFSPKSWLTASNSIFE
jgi:hypothetical protein